MKKYRLPLLILILIVVSFKFFPSIFNYFQGDTKPPQQVATTKADVPKAQPAATPKAQPAATPKANNAKQAPVALNKERIDQSLLDNKPYQLKVQVSPFAKKEVASAGATQGVSGALSGQPIGATAKSMGSLGQPMARPETKVAVKAIISSADSSYFAIIEYSGKKYTVYRGFSTPERKDGKQLSVIDITPNKVVVEIDNEVKSVYLRSEMDG